MSGGRSLTTLGNAVSDLEQTALDRLEDAEVLLRAGRYPSAIAFGLYALEIQFKVVICRRLDVASLPRVFETHELEALMLHSGLSNKVRRVKRPKALQKNWDELLQLSKTYSIDQFRYRPDPAWDEQLAKRVLHQLRDPPNGLLLWLRKQP
jgi:hypothetical protein